MCKSGFYWVFVRVEDCLRLVIHEPLVDRKSIESEGFKLVWDSARNEFEGAAYAGKHYKCYREVEVRVKSA
jgi:hypothetical protein